MGQSGDRGTVKTEATNQDQTLASRAALEPSAADDAVETVSFRDIEILADRDGQ